MSSYLVLARKYRPQNFDELVGQEVLVKTLSNAIKNNRLHQGYILTGIRGVGKTTTARIIAKTINCLDPNSQVNAKACQVCDNCKLITSSHHQDVIEIDAASKTGVDDIRQIIDSIAYAPVMAKYKVYIIDEVHMLSNQAFNALLKTLEEPPANVKFILATTEIRKVPLTILSRCQRFDLRRLDEIEIAEHLKNILNLEKIDFEDSALAMIAKSVDGSVRDSLSILDQALAINNHQQTLTGIVVEKMLGFNDNNKTLDLLEQIFQGNSAQAFIMFHSIYLQSGNVNQLTNDLLEMIHNITALKSIKDYKINALSPTQLTRVEEFANKIALSVLIRFWQIIIKSKSEFDYANNPRLNFEMMIIKLCHLVAIPDLSKILIEINSQSNSSLPTAKQDNISSTTNASILSKPSDDMQNHQNEIVAEILRSFPEARVV